jgi:hypothetical protein
MVPDLCAGIGRCPDSVVDFGCGDGSFLRWFAEAGSQRLTGIDANGPSDWAEQVQGQHIRADLTQPVQLRERYDLAVCLEVAEHLPASAAGVLVDSLCSASDRIVFSAAPPGQGGTGHINERPMGYWCDLFACRGYVLQDIFRHRLSDGVSPWYRANTFLAVRRGREVTIPKPVLLCPRYRESIKDMTDAVRDLMAMLGLAYHELSRSAVIDKVRSELASQWIRDPDFADSDYALWVDADNIFTPQQAIDLLVAAKEQDRDLLTGVYVTKELNARIVHKLCEGESVSKIGPYALQHQKIAGAGFGFVVTHRRLFERMAATDLVDTVWQREGSIGLDFFRPTLGDPDPMTIDPLTGVWAKSYRNEDYSFCERVQQMGVDMHMACNIIVQHEGNYRFGLQNLRRI